MISPKQVEMDEVQDRETSVSQFLVVRWLRVALYSVYTADLYTVHKFSIDRSQFLVDK